MLVLRAAAPHVEWVDVRRWFVKASPPYVETPMSLRVRELAAAGMDWREARDLVHAEFAERVRLAKVVEPPPPLPDPVEPGRAPVDGDTMPRTLPAWKAKAEAAGWRCRVVVSRGWKTDAKGMATALVTAISLRMARDGRRAVAMWHDGHAAGAWAWEHPAWPVRVAHEALQVSMGIKEPKEESAGQGNA